MILKGIPAAYRAWQQMTQYGLHPTEPDTLSVCDRWRSSFAAFLADMGRPPDGLARIHRIERHRPFTPDNCRWARRP